jgi:hypothetical protein
MGIDSGTLAIGAGSVKFTAYLGVMLIKQDVLHIIFYLYMDIVAN